MHTGGNNWHMWGFSHYIQQFHSEIYCDINISINTMHVRYAARNAGSSDTMMCLTISSLAVSHDSQGNSLFFVTVHSLTFLQLYWSTEGHFFIFIFLHWPLHRVRQCCRGQWGPLSCSRTALWTLPFWFQEFESSPSPNHFPLLPVVCRWYHWLFPDVTSGDIRE